MSQLAQLTDKVAATVESCQQVANSASDLQRSINHAAQSLDDVIRRIGGDAHFGEAMSLIDMATRQVTVAGEAAEAAVGPGQAWVAQHGASAGGAPSALGGMTVPSSGSHDHSVRVPGDRTRRSLRDARKARSEPPGSGGNPPSLKPPLEWTRPYDKSDGLFPPSQEDQDVLVNALTGQSVHPPAVSAHGTPAQWVQLVNDGGRKRPGRAENCLDCALSTISTWEGHPAVSGGRNHNGGEPTGIERAQTWLGKPLRYFGEGAAGLAELGKAVSAAGPGASALIVNTWPPEENGTVYSHAWNCLNQDGKLVWVDAQSGYAGELPHNNAVKVWGIVQ